MSSFTDHLSFSIYKKGLYKTRTEFVFYYNDDKTGEYLIVPAGTIFNGASIPKPIQKLFNWNPIDPRWVQASVVHDCLVGEFTLRSFVVNAEQKTIRQLSWNEAAKWFDKALKVKTSYNNCPKEYRHTFVLAVRFYGILKNFFVRN